MCCVCVFFFFLNPVLRNDFSVSNRMPSPLVSSVTFSQADRTGRSPASAWCSWRSRNWSSTSWSTVGRKLSARSWRARAGPRTPAARLHLRRQTFPIKSVLVTTKVQASPHHSSNCFILVQVQRLPDWSFSHPSLTTFLYLLPPPLRGETTLTLRDL